MRKGSWKNVQKMAFMLGMVLSVLVCRHIDDSVSGWLSVIPGECSSYFCVSEAKNRMCFWLVLFQWVSWRWHAATSVSPTSKYGSVSASDDGNATGPSAPSGTGVFLQLSFVPADAHSSLWAALHRPPFSCMMGWVAPQRSKRCGAQNWFELLFALIKTRMPDRPCSWLSSKHCRDSRHCCTVV